LEQSNIKIQHTWLCCLCDTIEIHWIS